MEVEPKNVLLHQANGSNGIQKTQFGSNLKILLLNVAQIGQHGAHVHHRVAVDRDIEKNFKKVEMSSAKLKIAGNDNIIVI